MQEGDKFQVCTLIIKCDGRPHPQLRNSCRRQPNTQSEEEEEEATKLKSFEKSLSQVHITHGGGGGDGGRPWGAHQRYLN